MTSRYRFLAAMLALALLPLVPSCRSRVGAPNANVLLIVIDTLRADHVGSYGYSRPTSPNLDKLAADGVRFAAARSTSSWTLPSVASIMTGLYPAVHGAEHSGSVLSDELDTMALGFRDAGYETAAFSANPAFVTPRQGLAHGFDRFDVLHGAEVARQTPGAVPADSSLTKWVLEATAEEMTSAALEWLGQRKADNPFFLYLHYFDPHAAYTPPADYARRFGVNPEARLAGDAQWSFLLATKAPPPSILATLLSLYDAEIAATDAAVGRLFDSISPAMRSSTIIVVTADHGEEFGDHGGVQHGRTLYDELLRVPLLISGPGVPKGRVAKAPVSLAGLRATLVDLTQTALPAEGTLEPSFASLFSREPDRASPVFADLEKRFDADRQQHRRALIDGSWKLLLDPERGHHLFDLATDAGEREEVQGSTTDTTRAARMRSEILDRDAEAVTKRASAPPSRLILDAAKREQLKALGYLQ